MPDHKIETFQVGQVVMARQHFTDALGERHIAGQEVGVVTFVDQREAEDVVIIDDAYNVRPASQWLLSRERWQRMQEAYENRREARRRHYRGR